MKKQTAKWLEIGRAIAQHELFKSPNIHIRRKFLVDEAKALEKNEQTSEVLSSQTLQRFVNVASFVDKQLGHDVDWSTFPIAVLEIIMRVDKLDPDLAGTMLKDLIEQRLTFRRALTLESDLRKAGPRKATQKPQSGIGAAGKRIQSIIRSTLDLSKEESLVQINPTEDWRFPLVKSHAVFVASRFRSASIFNERMLVVSVNRRRPLQEMMGTAFAACSLFKVVIVWLMNNDSAGEVLKYLERSECKPRNLILVVGTQLLRKDMPIDDHYGSTSSHGKSSQTGSV
jgi:hypothetical protein